MDKGKTGIFFGILKMMEKLMKIKLRLYVDTWPGKRHLEGNFVKNIDSWTDKYISDTHDQNRKFRRVREDQIRGILGR